MVVPGVMNTSFAVTQSVELPFSMTINGVAIRQVSVDK